MNVLANRRLNWGLAVAIGWFGATAVVMAEPQFHESFRFYGATSKPEDLHSLATSPDGRLVALSTGDSGTLSIVDLHRKEIRHQVKAWKFSRMAFSPNSDRLLGRSGLTGLNLLDVDTGKLARVVSHDAKGSIGLRFDYSNGKTIVTEVLEGYPLASTEVTAGDELLAYFHGYPSESSRPRWNSAIGKSSKALIEALEAPPGAWLQLRFKRAISGEVFEVSVPKAVVPRSLQRVDRGRGLLLEPGKHAFGFRSGMDGAPSAYADLQQIVRGIPAISEDARYFGVAGYDDDDRLWVEVHDLKTMQAKVVAPFPHRTVEDAVFSPAGDIFLVGTRDTIEVLDIASGEWQSSFILTDQELRDEGRSVVQRIPLGFGFPGDLYTQRRTTVYDRPAAVDHIAISPDGVVAVAGQTGTITFWSLMEKQPLDYYLEGPGKRIEQLEFSADGKYLMYFLEGTLHVYKLD